MNERVPLSFLLTQNASEEPPVEPVVPFPAMFGDEVKIVTAVLERTAVLSSATDRYERVTRRHDQVLVDPAAIEWRTKTATYEGQRLNEAARERKGVSKSPWRVEMAMTYERAVSRDEQRQRSDQRAQENRQRVKEAEEKELRFLRQRQRAQSPQEEKEDVSTPVIELPPAPTVTAPAAGPARKVKLRHCYGCGEDKPKKAFATKRGMGICDDCRAAGIKTGKATGKPRQLVATIPLGETVEIAAPARKTRRSKKGKLGRPKSEKAAHKISAEVTSDGSNGYEHVVKLLLRRDSLKADLARVNQQLQEALA